jgi:integrase
MNDPGDCRWIALMIATASRPGPALAFDPSTQWLDDILDLHPEGAARTDKRNAVVPVIDRLVPILEDWLRSPHEPVKSRKTWWRNMRRVLGLGWEVNSYTIRHTVATYMDVEGVASSQLSAIAGHLPSHRGIARTTSRNYLHYNPRNCPKAKRVLTKLFRSIEDGASRWTADHLRTTPTRGHPIALTKISDYP